MILSKIKTLIPEPKDGKTAASGLFVPSVVWIEANEEGWSIGTQSFNVSPYVVVEGVTVNPKSLVILSSPRAVVATYNESLGVIILSVSDDTDPVEYEGELKVRMEVVVGGEKYIATKGIPIVANRKGAPGPGGADSEIYEMEPSESVLHADKEGNIQTGAISVTAYRTKGENIRTRLAIGWDSAATEGHLHGVMFKIDSGSWKSCLHVENTAVVPIAEVATVKHHIAFRLVRGDTPESSMVVKECPNIPVVWDGKPGGTGKTGPMWCLAGTWDKTTHYKRTDEIVPVVAHTVGYVTNYWYLANENYTSIGEEPSAESNTWKLAEQFQMFFAEALFAPFASLGAAVVSEDFLFSRNGHISGMEYANGKTLYTSSEDYAPDATEDDISVPAYTRFGGDNVSGSMEATDIVGTNIQILQSFKLQRGVKVNVYFRFKGYGQVYIRRKGQTHPLSGPYTSSGLTSYDRSLSYLSTEDADYELVACATAADDGSDRTLSISWLEYIMTGMFEPNWWVNLRTGKMSSGSGGLVVDGDGNVSVRGALTYNKTLSARFVKVATDKTAYPEKHTFLAEPSPYTGIGVKVNMACNIYQLRGVVSYDGKDTYMVALPPARFFKGMELTIINACLDQSGSGASYVFNYGVGFQLYVPDEFNTSGADPEIENASLGQSYNRFGFLINTAGSIIPGVWERTLYIPSSVKRLTLIADRHPYLEWQSDQISEVYQEKCIAWLVSGFQTE